MSMQRFVDQFNELMSNRPLAILVMLGAAAGTVVGIAGGYYITYRLVTLIGAS
jgi:hypothetical protein